MNKTVALISMVTLLACSTCNEQAEKEAPRPPWDKIAAYIEAYRQVEKTPGLSVAVVWNNELAWSQGFGLADLENEVPATTKTVYRIGPVSKLITAVAVMQLVESNRLDLDADARNYAPEYPNKNETITVRHLLSHLSGIRPYTSEELNSQNHYEDLSAAVDVFKDAPLLAKPGERFIYTPYGYTLLGLVVERISGKLFDQYITDEIGKPLKMNATGPENLLAIVPHRSRGYALFDSGVPGNSRQVDLSGRLAGDGLVSTVEDLARLAIAVNTGSILTPETIDLMTTSAVTADGLETQHGLGWFVRTDRGRRIIGQGGAQPGCSAFFVAYPDHQMAVVVLANLEGTNVRELALTVGSMVLGDEVAETKSDR